MNKQSTEITKEQLAQEFTNVLSRWLSSEEWDEMVERNKNEKNPSICHSHDFCDANMAILTAFANLTGDAKYDINKHSDFFNDAWNIAKASWKKKIVC